MRIFAISDLHYSGLPPTKPMEIFHPMWENHRANIRQAWLEMITPDDTILIGGDTSWAMKWDDAKEDLDELVSLPGRKILIRGNHDYWWQTQARMTKAYGESLTFLQANALLLSNGTGIAGTRGWKVPGDPYFTEEDQPILERELERLKRALEALTELPANRRILLIHYPPVFSENQPSPDPLWKTTRAVRDCSSLFPDNDDALRPSFLPALFLDRRCAQVSVPEHIRPGNRDGAEHNGNWPSLVCYRNVKVLQRRRLRLRRLRSQRDADDVGNDKEDQLYPKHVPASVKRGPVERVFACEMRYTSIIQAVREFACARRNRVIAPGINIHRVGCGKARDDKANSHYGPRLSDDRSSLEQACRSLPLEIPAGKVSIRVATHGSEGDVWARDY